MSNPKINIIKEIYISKQKLNKMQKLKDIKLQKPFLKWVGGKSQIIEHITKYIVTDVSNMNNYHEIFLGGGSVLFAILSLQKEGLINIKKNIYAYDINPTLINVYKHVQNNHKELYKYTNKYIREYDSIEGDEINRNPTNIKEAKTSKESYYYWIRKLFNDNTKINNSVERSAVFMFLNKTCFRGVYREGPNGFNVPYGHYKKTPVIVTKSELENISQLIKHVNFQCCDFSQSISQVKKGDFVYLDPPYAPETNTSFVGYTKDGFSLETHKKLFEMIRNLHYEKNAKFLLSNAKVNMVTKYFDTFNIKQLKARRAIHSKNPETTTIEVLIHN